MIEVSLYPFWPLDLTTLQLMQSLKRKGLKTVQLPGPPDGAKESSALQNFLSYPANG